MSSEDDEEAWKDCVEWLGRCQMIPQDHLLTRSSETQFSDLAYYLGDGVILCYLINRLYPNAIEPRLFSQRPQHSQYLRGKNFRVFCDACRTIFGLSESDLFKPEELHDLKDFEKVIQTLASLSQTDLAKKSVARPFFLGSRKKVESSRLNESDYQDDSDIYDSVIEYTESNIYDVFGDENEDDIYGVLMYDKLAPPAAEKSQPKSQKDMCIDELICTEKKYLDVLHSIKTHFMEPLLSILEPDDFKRIFLKIEDLIDIHEDFYSNLCSTAGSSEEDIFRRAVSDCFIMFKDKFLIYGEFCSNLPSAQNRILNICTNSAHIKAAIEALLALESHDKVESHTKQKCQLKATEGKFMFRDMLAVPMQRVLKYSLLLKEMVKATGTNDPERKMLQKALEEMEDLSLYVNEVKRDNETLQLINEIEKNVINLIMPANTRLKDYGRLLMDGSLKVRSTSDNKTKPRNVFLFDKIVILCLPKGDANEYKDCLIMSQYNVDDTLPFKDKAFAHGFILRNKHESELYYAFGAKSQDLRKKWIDVFGLAQSNMNPPEATANGHHFTMTSFDKPVICDVCRKLLRGVFFQGYKCQKTQMSVHKECIPKAVNMNGPPTSIPFARRGSISTVAVIGRVKALQSYKGSLIMKESDPSQLTFEKGMEFDLVSDLGKLWTGRIGNKVGCFPKLYVTLLRDFEQERQEKRLSEQSADTGIQYPKNMRMGRRNTEPILPSCPPRLHRDPDHCLKNFPWYVGDLTREDASSRLAQRLNGTFLVRRSDKGGFALSVVYNSVRHIKIREIEGKVSLDGQVHFASIPEMIDHFKRISLGKYFSEIMTILAYPVHESDDSTKYCEAIYNYSATETDQISFLAGDHIAIVSKALEAQGWWRGRLNDKVGIFPYSYVQEI